MRAGVEMLAQVIPGVVHVSLADQAHDVDPRAIAPRLLEFLSE